MTVARSSSNTETRGSPSLTPVRPGRPEEPSSVHIPDETSPLLPVQPEPVLKSQRDLSEGWDSTVSVFLDTNAGLLLIVAAQFLFAASSITVKWLNSSDEHIPMLEVR